MAVAVDLNFPGATVDQYDAAVRLIGHGATGTPHVGGTLFHWAAVTNDAIRVVDVWDSTRTVRTVLSERIVPAVQQAGMPAPEIQFFDIHNYLFAESSLRTRTKPPA